MEDPAHIVEEASKTAENILHTAKNTAQATLSSAEAASQEMMRVASTDPTNADLKEAYERHAEDDRAFQKKQEEVNEDAQKSRDKIHERLSDIPTKEETALIVEEVLKRMFFSKGKLTISIILGAGAIAAALVAIIGGFKAVLALFLFSK